MPHRFSDPVAALLARWQRERAALIAPALLAFEVTSALRRLVYLKRISPARGEEALSPFLRLPIRLSSRRGLFPLAYRLAQIVGCEFWTADERLYHAARGKLAGSDGSGRS